jgi:phosphatidylglycerophosphatase A
VPAVPFLLCTWFGLGKLRPAPGSWGSLGALPFAWTIQYFGGLWSLAAATAAISLVALWAIGTYLRAQPGDDPGEIVIDEVAGQWLTLLFVPPDFVLYAIGFIIFRVLDITKPWPASWADRSLNGAPGVLVDDLLAGAYGAAIMLAILHYW